MREHVTATVKRTIVVDVTNVQIKTFQPADDEDEMHIVITAVGDTEHEARNAISWVVDAIHEQTRRT
jgi:hypothetical protein